METIEQQLQKEHLPNQKKALVLAVLSTILAGCIPPLSILAGISSLYYHQMAKTILDLNLEKYESISAQDLKATKYIAIIGIVLSSLIVLGYIIFFNAAITDFIEQNSK